MPTFSKRSLDRLSTCDTRLQKLFNEVIKEYDCTIICGHRGQIEQDIAYENGNSKLRYPHSKHNKIPSMAVDVAPYPINWKAIDRFKALAVVVYAKAKELDIEIEWGGDWIKFKDYPHWQLPD